MRVAGPKQGHSGVNRGRGLGRHPAGHAHGWEEVKGIYKIFGSSFSEQKLAVRDVSVHGDRRQGRVLVALRCQTGDGGEIQIDGRETQIYARDEKGWRLVHVHYSGPAMTR